MRMLSPEVPQVQKSARLSSLPAIQRGKFDRAKRHQRNRSLQMQNKQRKGTSAMLKSEQTLNPVEQGRDLEADVTHFVTTNNIFNSTL